MSRQKAPPHQEDDGLAPRPEFSAIQEVGPSQQAAIPGSQRTSIDAEEHPKVTVVAARQGLDAGEGVYADGGTAEVIRGSGDIQDGLI